MKITFALTIRRKLILGLGLSALVMLGIGYLGVHGESQSNTNTADIYLTDVQPILYIAQVRQAVQGEQILLSRMVVDRNRSKVAATQKQIADLQSGLHKAWALYYPMISSERERRSADAFATDMKRLDTLMAQSLEEAAHDRFDQAVATQSGDYERPAASMGQSIDVLYEENESQAHASYLEMTA